MIDGMQCRGGRRRCEGGSEPGAVEYAAAVTTHVGGRLAGEGSSGPEAVQWQPAWREQRQQSRWQRTEAGGLQQLRGQGRGRGGSSRERVGTERQAEGTGGQARLSKSASYRSDAHAWTCGTGERHGVAYEAHVRAPGTAHYARPREGKRYQGQDHSG